MCSDGSGNLYIGDSATYAVYRYNTITGTLNRVLGNGSYTNSIIPGGLPNQTAIGVPSALFYVKSYLYAFVNFVDPYQNIVATQIIKCNDTSFQVIDPQIPTPFFLQGSGIDSLGNILYQIQVGRPGQGLYRYEVSTGITTYSSAAGINGSLILLADNSVVYVGLPNFYRIPASPDGSISVFTSSQLYYTPGVLNNVGQFAITPSGILYFFYVSYGQLAMHVPNGTEASFFPNAQGFSGDGGPISNAAINTYSPASGGSVFANVAVDPSGNVYLLDGFNKRIRKINVGPNGYITSSSIINTVIGNGTSGTPTIVPINGL